MPLTEDEREELERLETQFGTRPENTCEVMIQGDGVYAVTFDADLVEEDERYDYLGKFDDMPPGKHELAGGAGERAIVDAAMLGKAPVLVSNQHPQEAWIDLSLVDRQPPDAVGGRERA